MAGPEGVVEDSPEVLIPDREMVIALLEQCIKLLEDVDQRLTELEAEIAVCFAQAFPNLTKH